MVWTAPDAESVITSIRADILQRPGQRLLILRLATAPPLTVLIDRMSDLLSEAALALWPNWYSGDWAMPRDLIGLDEYAAARSSIETVVSRVPGVSASWLRMATAKCLRTEPPWDKAVDRALQMRQITKAIARQTIRFVIVLDERLPSDDRLMGLERGAEWLASTTEVDVLLLLAGELQDPPIAEPPNSTAVCNDDRGEEALRVRQVTPQEHRDRLWPVIGQPHPFSPGEQLLARLLSNSPDLAEHFEFNQLVETKAGERFLVDLLWQRGQLVVEVDGFAFHGSQAAFSEDRRRDFELTVEGYTVVRLPHDLVMDRPEIAMERIRRLVTWKRSCL